LDSRNVDATAYWENDWEVLIDPDSDQWTLKLLSANAPTDTYTFSIYIYSTATQSSDGLQANQRVDFDIVSYAAP
jgi:hypothetical protein